MKNVVSRIKAFCLTALFSTGVLADLPARPSAESNSNTSGGYLANPQNYIVDGLVLLGLLVAAYAFIRVAMNVIQAYGEISDGKATYRELGAHVLVGIVILSLIMYLLNLAMDIF